MNPQKQELIEKLKAANNILVTVSANPSVDQLSACIGITLLLNKLKKHATAVFSGAVPSTIEFLKPEETIEKNTDSLRDFIISLDKTKADKLRYKVEDQVVRIFITPYKTSITQEDLEFGQGDFNVDAVLCLGVNQQQDLDQAITSHGRILHDAAVLGINIQPSELGTINWTEPTASSLSELVAGLADNLGEGLLDSQIATAMLTGIVAETARFSNEKTSPETMRLSAELMAAGANQQLVASELEVPQQVEQPPTLSTDDQEAVLPDDQPPAPVNAGHGDDGTIEISHNEPETEENFELPTPQDELAETPEESSIVDQLIDGDTPVPSPLFAPDSQPPAGPGPDPRAMPEEPEPEQEPEAPAPTSRLVLQPPTLGGVLTANAVPEEDNLPDVLGSISTTNQPATLDHAAAAPEQEQPAAGPDAVVGDLPLQEAEASPGLKPVDESTVAADPVTADDQSQDAQVSIDPDGNLKLSNDTPSDEPADSSTLSDLEASVDSPHTSSLQPAAPGISTTDLNAARDAVMDAINDAPAPGELPATQASGSSGYLNVQDLPDVNDGQSVPADLTEASATPQEASSSQLTPPSTVTAPSTPSMPAANTPPPVPPPLPLSNLSEFASPGE